MLAPVIVLAGLLLSACDLISAGQASQTTPDIEATVTAAVQSALATQVAASATPATRSTTDIETTLSAPVRTAIAAQATALAPQPTATRSATPVPTPTLTPTPTDTSLLTHTTTPTPTVVPPTPPTLTHSPIPLPPTATPTPTSTPGPGNLVFASKRDGNLEIYVMSAEPLASATRITDRPGVDSGPRWFPSGQRIAFYGSGGGGFHIYAVDSDGQNLVQLTTGNFNDTNPDVSITGTQIVFLSDRDAPADIFVMNADGTNVKQLANSGSVDTPSWSPDGSRIAFSRDGDMWAMDADGANQTMLFGETDPKSAGYAAWSPDSMKLLYATDRDTQHGNTQTIYVTDPEGDVHIPLTDDGVAPAWSPSGDKIVFQRWVGSNYELLQMNSDGGGVEQITFNPAADIEPDWTR